MLSRDCDGCISQALCARRYRLVQIKGKVYCSNGDAHLVDSDSIEVEVPLP